ncbi:MAG: hypothetical protein KJZ57_00100 [Anaerolineales bacterium]|jgi:hypothetical protein|nr:hypothetical protein [Anaerolineales bacterium]
MNTATARTIVNAAIEFLCAKHGVTEAQIEAAVRAGDRKVIDQIATLLTAGIGAAMERS